MTTEFRARSIPLSPLGGTGCAEARGGKATFPSRGAFAVAMAFEFVVDLVARFAELRDSMEAAAKQSQNGRIQALYSG